MSAELEKAIENARKVWRRFSRFDSTLSEATTQTTIVLPVLRALGWDTTNPWEVYLEHGLQGLGRADIALFINEEEVVFIETKKRTKKAVLENEYEEEVAKQQLLKYCRGVSSVRLGILTDGMVWYLYPRADDGVARTGEYKIRRRIMINLAEDHAGKNKIAGSFAKYISRKNFSGKGARAASGKARTEAHSAARIVRNSKQEMRSTMRALLAFLLREPSVTQAEIAAALDMSRGGVYSLLKKAEERGHIRKAKQGGPRAYQVLVDPDSGVKLGANTARSQSGAKGRSALATRAGVSETTRSLLEFLLQDPTATLAQVAEKLRITRGGAYAALKRAESDGHIRKMKQGSVCTYTVLTDPGL